MTHTQTQGADGAGTKTAGDDLPRNKWGEPDHHPIIGHWHVRHEIKAAADTGYMFGKNFVRLADAIDFCEQQSGQCRLLFHIDGDGWLRIDRPFQSYYVGAAIRPAPAATPGEPDSLRALTKRLSRAVKALNGSQLWLDDNSPWRIMLKRGRFNAAVAEAHPESAPGDGEWSDGASICAIVNEAIKLDALIAAQPAGQAGDAGADGWLPIETAPKDGTRVNLWVVPHDAFANGNADRLEARWMERVGWVRIGGGYVSECGKPTHWRPRPGAPGKPAPDSACTGQAEQLRRIGHAVRDVVRSAWSLCDLTEDGGEPGQDIPPTAWKQLADAVTALEALIPADEQPASAGHAVTLLIEALAARQPTPNSTRTGAAETVERHLREALTVAASRMEVASMDWGIASALASDKLTHADDMDKWAKDARAVLAARPEAPSDAGWSFDMEAAPRDGTPINVGRDNGCGWDLLVVWWSKSATEYPWHTEGGGEYPEHRFDCWATLTPPSDPAPSGQAEG